MYLTSQGKFDNESAVKTVQELQLVIKELAKQAPSEASIEKPDGTVIPINLDAVSLPLDILLEDEDKIKIRRMSEDFVKGKKLSEKVSKEFIYSQLINFFSAEKFYLNDNLPKKELSFFFQTELMNIINQEICTTKLIFFNIIGASLNRGDICKIGPVEFINQQDFINTQSFLLDIFKNSKQDDDSGQVLIERFLKCDLIAKVQIKNRDANTSEIAANEIIKRLYAVISLLMPMVNTEHSFFGTVGEQYLDSMSSFVFIADSNNENNIETISMTSKSNYILNRSIDLLHLINLHKQNHTPQSILLARVESIVYKFINHELNDFEERIWIAIYWLGEVIYEREINQKIIKYATILETLFNTQKSGIAEQISEFTAHVVGLRKTQSDRLDIYNHTKKLYDMRSQAVHGQSLHQFIDENFLSYTQWICKSALFIMADYSGIDYYQGDKGHKKFVEYILKYHRFY